MHNVYKYDYTCVVFHSLRKVWTWKWWIKQTSDNFVVEILFSSIFLCSLRNPVRMRRTFSKICWNMAFSNISERNEKENATYYLFLMTRCYKTMLVRYPTLSLIITMTYLKVQPNSSSHMSPLFVVGPCGPSHG